MADLQDIPWLRAVPAPSWVATLAADRYGFTAPRVSLVRTFVNDVFRVDAVDSTYAFKLYGPGRWTADEVRWEQSLAAHLVSRGVPVAAPVALTDGDTVGTVEVPDGTRPFAMTAWAAGDKPRYPFTDELYARFGAALARFHDATVDFLTDLPRRPARGPDQAEEIVAALREGSEFEGRPDTAERIALLERSHAAADRQVHRLAADGLRHGLRHGDASMDNLHVAPDGLHLYDLDLAAPGWVVEDLTGALSTDHADAFLTGYTAVRELRSAEVEALPWLRILDVVENLHFHVVRKPLMLGTSTIGEGWVDDAFTFLAESAERAGL